MHTTNDMLTGEDRPLRLRPLRAAGPTARHASDSIRLLRAALDPVSQIILCLVPSGIRLLAASRAARKALGYRRRELLSLGLEDILATPTQADARRALEAVLRGDRREVTRRMDLLRKDGSEIPVRLLLRRVEDAGCGLLILTARDLRPARRRESRVAEASQRDPLTGLPNRTTLQRAMQRARRRGIPFGLFFLDLDGFKAINDTLGHLAGDCVLREVARRLLGCIRPDDLAARYGGDEFVLVVNALSGESEVVPIARRIQDALRVPIFVEGRAAGVSASIGIALSCPGDSLSDELLRDADRAMYQAKRLGAGRYVVSRR